MKGNRKTLLQLFVPICLETFLYMMAGMIDTLMLAYVGDQAIGAVGTANTYIGIFIIMFAIISSGMVAVMTQYIGAGRDGVAYQARQLGLAFNAVLGIGMSIFLFTCAGKILSIVGIARALMEPAETYLRIVGGACILNALIPIFANYLRVFGYSKEPLYASILGNVINLILNAVFIFILHMGVCGVAIATVIARAVNLLLVAAMGAFWIKAKYYTERVPNRMVLRQIIKIGFPSALEIALYNVAMTIVIRFLNQMDPEGLNVTARSYTVQITSFAYCAGAALAQANAIMTGWRIGSEEYEECDRGTRKAALTGIVVAACIEILIVAGAEEIMKIFTDNVQMIILVKHLLFIDIFLEMGRVTNLVYGNALKASGDAIFPVVIGAVFMFLCAVGGTYVFGIRMGLLAVGAYIGLTADECIRAVGMFLRWRSGKWRSKGLVH